jgi:hypothetical protein
MYIEIYAVHCSDRTARFDAKLDRCAASVELFTEQDSELLATSFDPEKMRDNCDSHRTSHPQTRDRNLIVNCTALRWWQNRCISET